VQEIDSTVGIMRDNINKVSERGERLDSLQDKTDNLAVSAQGFRRGANRVRKAMWWKDMKMRMCIIGAIIVIILIAIIVPRKLPLLRQCRAEDVANPCVQLQRRSSRDFATLRFCDSAILQRQLSHVFMASYGY
jgi:hypothetical protein